MPDIWLPGAKFRLVKLGYRGVRAFEGPRFARGSDRRSFELDRVAVH